MVFSNIHAFTIPPLHRLKNPSCTPAAQKYPPHILAPPLISSSHSKYNRHLTLLITQSVMSILYPYVNNVPNALFSIKSKSVSVRPLNLDQSGIISIIRWKRVGGGGGGGNCFELTVIPFTELEFNGLRSASSFTQEYIIKTNPWSSAGRTLCDLYEYITKQKSVLQGRKYSVW